MRKEADNPLFKLVKTCKDLGEKSDDPCLTQYCIETFPQIKGYIAIANTDKNRFFIQYKKFIEKNIQKLNYVLPSICSNSRESIGIPEIVIHPLHLRKNDDEIIRHRLWGPEVIINYTKKFRAMYNYFPLVYVSSNHIASFNQIGDDNLIEQLKQDEVDGNPIQTKLFNNLHKILDNLLSPSGMNIDGTIYKCTVDVRTGFYRLFSENRNNTTKKNNKSSMMLFDAQSDSHTVIPFEYSVKNKTNVMKTIGLTNESLPIDIHEKNLNMNGLSISKSYLFKKGNKKLLEEKYKLKEVLARPDLTSKKKLNKTRKIRR
jgi:hypothetical protein